MTIEQLTLPIVIWYMLPGLNAILMVVILPILVCDFPLLSSTITWGGVLGWLLAGFIVGFLLDSIKLYQFTIGYKREKARFFSKLSEAIKGEAEIECGRMVFIILRLMLNEKNKVFPFWEHSRWVMVNHSSKMAMLSCAVWVMLLYTFWAQPIVLFGKYNLTAVETRVLLAFMAVLMLVLAVRLDRESRHILFEANRIYVQYVHEKVDDIRKRLSVHP